MSYDRQQQTKDAFALDKKINQHLSFADIDTRLVWATSPPEGGVEINLDGNFSIQDLEIMLFHMKEFDKKYPKK